MPDRRCISLTRDMRSEAALSLMPARGQEPAEVLVIADSLEMIDAWGATALRTAVEFCARVQQQQVSVSQPKSDRAWLTLYHLLAHDPPSHLILTDDSSVPKGSQPSSIQMPAVRVPSLVIADQMAEALLGFPQSRLSRALRYLATQLPELVANALHHGMSSPTAPVACCFHDGEEDELQLVVTDLGATYDRDTEAELNLLGAVRENAESALNMSVEVAAARGLDATLTLAAGPGRVYWKAGKWSSATAQAVSGFTAALCVQLD